MAHECPECYSVCYCGGDIDDIELPAGALTCSHCDGRLDLGDDGYDYDYDYHTAHEFGACGGDCPDCQAERAERREGLYSPR